MLCVGVNPQSFHLLLRTGDTPVSHLMKRLLTGYAMNFNRRYNRYGYLFQNRCHGGRAGIKLLKEKGGYQKGDERILGDGQFVEEVLEKAKEKLKEKYSLRSKGYTIDRLIKRVSGLTGLTPEQITDGIRDKKRTEVRSILCYWTTEKLGITQSELTYVLNRSQSAIVYAEGEGILSRLTHTMLNKSWIDILRYVPHYYTSSADTKRRAGFGDYLENKMSNERANEPGIILGIFIIIMLITLGVLSFFFGFETGPIKKGPASILTAIYIETWGIVFLLSYFYSHKSFIFRGIIWVCENLSCPKGRFMAIGYSLLAFGLGTVALIQAI